MNFFKKVISNKYLLNYNKYNFCDLKLFEINLAKAKELLKVSNLNIVNQSTMKVIDILFICSIYKNYEPQLIPKIENKLAMSIRDLDEYNLSKVINSFSVINYNSKNLNFLIERTLIARMEKITIPIFIKILKSLSFYKSYIISKGLLNVIKLYIETNMPKMTPEQMASILIDYAKIPASSKELLKKLYDGVENEYDKLNPNMIAYLYFIINGGIRGKGFEEIVSKPEYVDIIIKNENPGPKIIYLLVLANHYSRNFSIDIYLEKYISIFLDKFTPEEINSIILIRNSKEYKINEELNKKFADLALKDSNEMSLDELILYLQSLLSLPNKYTDIILKFEELIFNTKFSSIKIYQIVSILDLLRHFGINNFKFINLDTISQVVLREMKLKTTSDLSANLFSDYYIIALILFDLKYRNLEFWKQYLAYSDFLKDTQHIEKMKTIINKLTEEIPELK